MEIKPYYISENKDFILYQGNNVEILKALNTKFDMVFADPPYFLSNDGLTFKNGKIDSVNKGKWDKLISIEQMNQFNLAWIKTVRDKMKDNATIWISGTMHNIFNIGYILQQLDFKILNTIIWQKTNPPPNFSKRYFQHSTEIIIWARKLKNVPHYFNHELMKKFNNNRQMQDVWRLPAIAPWEKECGKHPTQKPLKLLARIILASTQENALILDPFTGSSSTGIAANLFGRKFIGIDIEEEYLKLSICRRELLNNPNYKAKLKKRLLQDFSLTYNIFS